MEALIRWQHPELGLLPPLEFIGHAETRADRSDRSLGAQNRCAYNQTLQSRVATPLTVSVNLSARQFEDKHLLREIERALSESALKPNCLELEITESMVMKDTTSSKKILDGSSRWASASRSTTSARVTRPSRPSSGFRSTASRSTALSSRHPQDPDDVAITQAIIAMAHSLRLKVIAEGVETQEQLDFLTEHGCHEFQGYFFRKPQAAEDFSKLLRDNAGAMAATAESAPGRLTPA